MSTKSIEDAFKFNNNNISECPLASKSKVAKTKVCPPSSIKPKSCPRIITKPSSAPQTHVERKSPNVNPLKSRNTSALSKIHSRTPSETTFSGRPARKLTPLRSSLGQTSKSNPNTPPNADVNEDRPKRRTDQNKGSSTSNSRGYHREADRRNPRTEVERSCKSDRTPAEDVAKRRTKQGELRKKVGQRRTPQLKKPPEQHGQGKSQSGPLRPVEALPNPVEDQNALIGDRKSLRIGTPTMVRENGGTRVLPKKSPLKPIRYVESSDKTSQEKRDRIQRYKEERRKQIAARYGGTIEPSSSDEENANSTSALRRRRKQRQGLDSSSTDVSVGENVRSKQNGSCGDLRASEERRPALGTTVGSGFKQHLLDGTGACFKSETLSDHSFNRIQSQRDSADSPLSGSDGRGSRRRTSTEERDKSHKRKSHLNRASTSEEAVYPQPMAHLSDSSEDVPRRRRRRPVAEPISEVTSSRPALLPPTPLSPLRSPALLSQAGTQSAPSTLHVHAKEEPKRSQSFKAAPLKKPEIPDVLKPKEAGGFPPSSIVLEKPPVAPEGLVRALKKSPEVGGTCFMATRRDKRDEQTSDSELKVHLDQLTSQALELTSRAQSLNEDTMVHECETYLSANKDAAHQKPSRVDTLTTPAGSWATSGKVVSSTTGQKNWIGGPEGNSEKIIRRLAFEEDVKHKTFSSDAAVSSGPPNSESPTKGLEPSPPLSQSPSDTMHSILVRRASREEFADKSGILKRKTSCSKVAVADGVEGDPRPILKKRSSAEDDCTDPKSILKKKSLTDDELESDRPKSILKGARSREEIADRTDRVVSPILKRSSRVDSEGESGELRPILKRRDTSDGVHVHMSEAENPEAPTGRVRSDSAPDTRVCGLRSHSPSLPSAVPSHGILKRRSHPDPETSEAILRPRGNREEEGTSERPLSVAERIAGMEALQGKTVPPVSPSPGAKPKLRSPPSEESTVSPTFSPTLPQRELKRVSPSVEDAPEAINPIFTPSKVSQKAAFFAKLEQENVTQPKKDSSARFSTSQSVSEGEMNGEASIISDLPPTKMENEAPSIKEQGGRSDSSVGAKVALWSKRMQEEQQSCSEPSRRKTARFRTQPITLEEVQRASALNNSTPAKTPPTNASSTDAPKRSSVDTHLTRRFSTHDLSQDSQDSIRGILKSDLNRDRWPDSPRSILKCDSRKSSLCESEHPRGILKADSPSYASPERLRSVLKKDSSFEDGREIKSILKPQSHSLEPQLSSDSSSEVTGLESASEEAYSAVVTAGDYAEFCRKSRSSVKRSAMKEALKQAQPMKAKDNLAEALRQIEPLRSKREQEHLVTSFEETVKTEDQVTFRHKKTSFNQHERWTFNEFSSPSRASRSSDSSSSSSSSPNAVLPPTPPEGTKSPHEPMQSLHTPPGGTKSPLEPLQSPPDLLVPETPFAHCPARSSINERLAALQKNGEEGWKSRVSKFEGDSRLDPISPKNGSWKGRPTSLTERLSRLETSSTQWKGRVSQSDATKFTVAHKMASASSIPALLSSSPASERKKRSPQPKVFKSTTASSIPDLVSNKNLDNENISVEMPKKASANVSIPRIHDDSFNDFFTTSSSLPENAPQFHFSLTDFDHVSNNTHQLNVKRRSVRVARKNQTRGNPLKSLAAREDLKEEYTEIKLGAGEKALRRIKVEELSKSSSLAMEALAGLASKENFSAVSLKKVEESPVVRELCPFRDTMLIQVKGRRRPQVRLVQPTYESVNSGDDFLLITPSEVFHYKGQFTNVIERAVASEIGLYILQTKDLGIGNVFRVTEVQENSPLAKKERFWSKLGGNSETKEMSPGDPESDDHYELAMVASNKVFEVQGDALSPINQAWGQSPKYDLLQPEKVLVFDFGSEVYFWAGKRAPPQDKKRGLSLLKALWEEEVDYSDCDINPIDPSRLNPSNKGRRPEWGLCGKITENVETILFKEKFVDWPDVAQQSRIKEVLKETDHKCDAVNELDPCDVTTMLSTKPESPDLVLEMSHLGRGVQYYDNEERRMHNISTNEIKVWHISENEKKLLEEDVASDFYADETYVVRWFYHVTATGRTLKGTPSKHNVTGRYRVAYFFWQGQSSSVSDKGVSALMTVELDEERGPHVRVTMGHEPPTFLNLFNGRLVVHKGPRGSSAHQWRLFIVRGACPNEAHLVQVDVSPEHLRSRGCLILTHSSSAALFLWKGCRTSSTSKKVAAVAARLLQQRDSRLILREETEGKESKDFLNGIRLNRSSPKLPYHSLLNSSSSSDLTPRIWRLEASHNSFQAHEISSSYRLPDAQSPFPVWQEELYSVQQPALFLIDAGHKLFSWQGWWPDEVVAEDETAASTGSAFLRLIFARRALLQTVLDYVAAEGVSGRMAEEPELVVAGMEPLYFTNLFPVWKVHQQVAAVQEKEGRWHRGKRYLVSDVYKQLCRSRFSVDELHSRPLPDGVDPSRLENYLSDADFELALGVSKDAFATSPTWKQLHMKKKANLF